MTISRRRGSPILQVLAVALASHAACTVEIYDQRQMRDLCGNALLDPGEVCDDGNRLAGDGCSADCKSIEVCGNGVLDPREVCDDGNTTSGDGCSADCTSDERCGNGIRDVEEMCDTGGESATCDRNCTLPRCGDGVLNTLAGEICDDGNTRSGDGCSADCRSTEVCGNRIVDVAAGEVCDDGNILSGDGCSADCRTIEVNGDRCSTDCTPP